MVIHELGTNALKYGALSRDEGRVEASWTLQPRGLSFVWQEVGGPPARPPSRQGLGFRVIRAGIERQLDGTVDMDWTERGLSCRITLPEEHVRS